jgi:hypothetical protein
VLCTTSSASLFVGCSRARTWEDPGLPYSDSNVDLEFGRGVRTPLPYLRFRNPLELMNLVMSDAFTVGISAGDLNATDLKLDIQDSAMESHPVDKTIHSCF